MVSNNNQLSPNTITLENEFRIVTIVSKQPEAHISDFVELFRGALMALGFHPDTVADFVPSTY